MADAADSPVQIPQTEAERNAVEQLMAQALASAANSLTAMAAQYRRMTLFRSIAGLPATDDAWTTAHENGAQTLYSAYALAYQYVSEAQAGMRVTGKIPGSDDIGVTGRDDEVSVRGDSDRVELVRATSAEEAAAQAGEQALIADVEKSGYVAIAPALIIAAGIVVTAAAMWSVSEICEVVKKQIEKVKARDAEQLPIKLREAGYTAEQAAQITHDTLAQAETIASAKNSPESGTQSIVNVTKTIVWGGAVLILVGAAAYVGAPYLREVLTSQASKRQYAAA